MVAAELSFEAIARDLAGRVFSEGVERPAVDGDLPQLTALADRTLPPDRQDTLLHQVSVSPQLARALRQQLVAIEAVRRLDTPAPTQLRERIQGTGQRDDYSQVSRT